MLVGGTGFSAGSQAFMLGDGRSSDAIGATMNCRLWPTVSAAALPPIIPALLRRTIVRHGVFMVLAENLSKNKKGILRCLRKKDSQTTPIKSLSSIPSLMVGGTGFSAGSQAFM